MTSMLLRSLRRLTSLDAATDLEESCRTEFGVTETDSLFDHSLSVYLIEEVNVVQTQSEHVASFQRPPGGARFQGTSIDLGNIVGETESEPGETLFAFTKRQHRVITLGSDDDVRTLARVMREQRESRERRIDVGDVRAFIRKQSAAKNPEWEACLTAKPNWKEWANKGQQAAVVPPRPALRAVPKQDDSP